MSRIRFVETQQYLYSPQDQERRDNVVIACRLMLNAAMTAPVPGGIAQLEAEIIQGQDEQEALARKMEELAYTRKAWQHVFLYEAVQAREADAILLLGNTKSHSWPWDGECGACGGDNCGYVYSRRKGKNGLIDNTDRRRDTLVGGPQCAFYAHTLGYAIGAALMVGVRLCVDVRPYISMGVAAEHLGHCRNSELVIAVAAGARQRNQFMQIPADAHLVSWERHIEAIRSQVGQGATVGGVDYQAFNPELKNR